MLRATGIILALAIQASLTLALSSGPPSSACGNRTPSHGVPPQTSEPPYEFDLHYHDDHFDVAIIADSGAFLGFMMQAVDSNGNLVGRFEPKDSKSKLMNCDNQGDSISHSSSEAKDTVYTAFYLPDGVSADGIVIKATVVQNYATFWTNMESIDLGDLRAARARDCFHLPRGNQRILRGQKANVQLANTGGQKFAENKEPES
ncbi:hypothetical protein CAPTEDRAFT_200310 [Capitella teleta]|uniref:Reelin domain-containing protein n=1 Tax=Capitella teleta TaxID=283909 RepID=R7UTC5_CAPTE|nr:hypothetical protein CAPTEDRAFT_200310 [Capitella teleta]|eukprot:ELU09445.1 hypothetical protein CAPTEDRAFT_200310 [Capitella teleta]